MAINRTVAIQIVESIAFLMEAAQPNALERAALESMSSRIPGGRALLAATIGDSLPDCE